MGPGSWVLGPSSLSVLGEPVGLGLLSHGQLGQGQPWSHPLWEPLLKYGPQPCPSKCEMWHNLVVFGRPWGGGRMCCYPGGGGVEPSWTHHPLEERWGSQQVSGAGWGGVDGPACTVRPTVYQKYL